MRSFVRNKPVNSKTNTINRTGICVMTCEE